MVSRKPRPGSLMVRGTSLEELERKKSENQPTEANRQHCSGPNLPCLYPAYRFNTTTTAEPSGRISATVSKSFFSLATNPTLWDPSGMNLLNVKTGIIRDSIPEGTVQSGFPQHHLCSWDLPKLPGDVPLQSQLCGSPGQGNRK